MNTARSQISFSVPQAAFTVVIGKHVALLWQTVTPVVPLTKFLGTLCCLNSRDLLSPLKVLYEQARRSAKHCGAEDGLF